MREDLFAEFAPKRGRPAMPARYVTFDRLLEDLSLIDRLDGMLERCIKRLLMVRGVKSLAYSLLLRKSGASPLPSDGPGEVRMHSRPQSADQRLVARYKWTDPNGSCGVRLLQRIARTLNVFDAWTCDGFQRRNSNRLRTNCRFDAIAGTASSAGERRAA